MHLYNTKQPGIPEQKHSERSSNNSKWVNKSEKSKVNNQIQAKIQPIRTTSKTESPTLQKKENRTGLPDRLKSGVENLSGYSMDDVKVHYNSSKPAQLNAHAYAQGTNIHLGPGQEKHLPHEAWHVVQQKQGRVGSSFRFEGTSINDTPSLEKEATVMGQKATVVKLQETGLPSKLIREEANGPAQLEKMEVIAYIMTILSIGTAEAMIFYEYLSNYYRLPIIVGSLVLPWLAPWLKSTYQGWFQYAEAQRVTRTNEQGGLVPNITPGLENAHIQDIRGNAYLQEGEGNLLANRWNINAEIFIETDEEIAQGITRINSNGLNYGNGANQGRLLFVNGNHYVTLEAAADGIYQDGANNRYNRGIETISDGNCLIDGLYIIANNVNANAEQLQEARDYIANNIPTDTVNVTLQGMITGMIAGEHQPGIGSNVSALMLHDKEFWLPYLDELEIRRKEDLQKEKEASKIGDDSSDSESKDFNLKNSYVEKTELSFRIEWNKATKAGKQTIRAHNQEKSKLKSERELLQWIKKAEGLLKSRKKGKKGNNKKGKSNKAPKKVQSSSILASAPSKVQDPSFTIEGIILQRGPYAGEITHTIYVGKQFGNLKGGAEPLIIIPMNSYQGQDGVEIHVHLLSPAFQVGDYTTIRWINIYSDDTEYHSQAGGAIGADLMKLLNQKSDWNSRKKWNAFCSKQNAEYKMRKKKKRRG